MAVVLENSGSGTSVGSTTHVCSLGFTATAGRLLIAGFGTGAGTAAFQNLESGWALIHDNHGSARSMAAAWAYKVAAGGETSVTIETSISLGGIGFVVAEFSGLDGTAPLDQAAEDESNNSSLSASCATGTTASLATSTGFAVSFWSGDSSSWIATGRSYTNGSTEIVRDSTAGSLLAYKQLSSSSGFSETVSGTGSDQCYGSVAVFKQAAASALPTLGTVSATAITSSGFRPSVTYTY